MAVRIDPAPSPTELTKGNQVTTAGVEAQEANITAQQMSEGSNSPTYAEAPASTDVLPTPTTEALPVKVDQKSFMGWVRAHPRWTVGIGSVAVVAGGAATYLGIGGSHPTQAPSHPKPEIASTPKGIDLTQDYSSLGVIYHEATRPDGSSIQLPTNIPRSITEPRIVASLFFDKVAGALTIDGSEIDQFSSFPFLNQDLKGERVSTNFDQAVKLEPWAQMEIGEIDPSNPTQFILTPNPDGSETLTLNDNEQSKGQIGMTGVIGNIGTPVTQWQAYAPGTSDNWAYYLNPANFKAVITSEGQIGEGTTFQFLPIPTYNNTSTAPLR